MLGPKDLRGVYAIIPTPAKDGADRWDAENTVDLAETERVVNALVRDGVQGLIVLGTTGECATLTNDEYEAFVDCVLATMKKRLPTFVGTTALGTHEVVRRTRFAAERGADGVLLGLPMWQPLTTDMAVEYYRSISEAFPKTAIMVYGNGRAFRFKFPPEFWSRVVDVAPTLMAAKYSRPESLLAALEASKGRVHFLPHDGGLGKFAQLSPETTTACWSTAASMGPGPVLAQMRAQLANDAEEMRRIAADLSWVREPIKEIVSDAELFATYNIQLEKIRIEAAGYCKAGPIRPPYNFMPQPYLEKVHEHAQRWRQLCEICEGDRPVSEPSVDRLAAVEIGVPDLAASCAFYEEVWGLSPIERMDETCHFRAAGPEHYVLALHRRAAPCFVRMRLGAADRATVDALADRVRKADAALLGAPGPLSTPGGGYGFAFLDPEGREFQILCDVQTHAGAVPANDRPWKLSHVVLNSPDCDRAAAFARDTLGFRLRDRTRKACFMGCGADHHSIAFSDRKNSRLSHAAFELPDLDAVLRGCGRLKRAGLTVEWGVGRHGTGDNVFAYFVDPNNGFAIEYTTEMEQVDDRTYVPGSPESIARAAFSDVWGLADPPTERLLQAFQGPAEAMPANRS